MIYTSRNNKTVPNI